MDGYVTISTELDTKSFDAQIDYVKSQLDDIEDKLKQADMGFEVGDTQKLEAQYEKLTDKLKNLIKKKQEFNSRKGFDFSGIKESVDGVGNSIQKVTKRIGKMALAVFGIRSAFMFVRNAINTIAGDDEQLKADIEYMKNALAYSLEPIVRAIVDLARQLMFYVGYIIKAWTGKNIFENADKSLQNANKNATKLKKTLSSFDELEILQDNSNTSSGIATPSFNLGNLDNIEAPAWIQWIADNKDIILDALWGIAGAITAMKLSKFAESLGLVGKHLSFIKGLGIAAIIFGILQLLKDIIDIYAKVDGALENNGTSFQDWGKILIDIGIIILGIAALIASIPVAVAGAIGLILGLIMNFWDTISQWFTNAMNWLWEKAEWLSSKGEFLLSTFLVVSTGIVKVIRDLFEGLFTAIKQILDGILLIFKGQFANAFANIGKGIGNIFITIINVVINAINAVWTALLNLVDAAGSLFGKEWNLKTKLSIPKIPYLAKGGIVNNPGPGVMMGSYIAGEKGPEAVIPLDDNTLDRLGIAFARHTIINATMINQMNGRVISRELQKVQNDSDFAYNR